MKVILDPLEYDVVFVDNPNYGDNLEVFGFIDPDNCVIQIKKDLKPVRARIVLMHELLHGMLMRCGLNLKEEENDHYENIVECLSHSLISIIRNNPDLMKYLADNSKE